MPLRNASEVRNDATVAPPLSRAQRITSCVDQLQDELRNLLDSEALYQERIQKLETELSAFKRAYANVDGERQELQALNEEAGKQVKWLQNQLKGHRIIALLDGDGAIFNHELITRGQAGGYAAAAQTLSDTILHFLTSNYGGQQYQLWVYIYFNKRGLLDAFGRAGNPTAKTKFEDFYMGFNEAAERFLMVDVGSGKEAADAKIKAHLEADICLPQTYKIVFGGCHDNGYVASLRSLITAGYKEKIILLPTYSEIATGISDLELPMLTIPELFLTQKLGIVHNDSGIQPDGPVPPSFRNRPQTSSSVVGPSFLFQDVEQTDTCPEQGPQHRCSSSSMDSDGNSEALKYHTPPSSFSGSQAKYINPNIALMKHKPVPCTLHYLKVCKVGANCRYGHDYILKPEHYEELRVASKKIPCSNLNRGEPCGWGKKCCWGHHCPYSSKCYYLKQGRCRFLGADMHKDPDKQDEEY